MREAGVEVDELTARAAAGDSDAWGALVTAYEERLLRMVSFRLDARLRGRVDAADVVQEAFVEAAAHRADYFAGPAVSLFLWLRGVVGNKLLELHRHHLGTRMRDAAKEAAARLSFSPDATSVALVDHLAARAAGPGTAAAGAEATMHLREALAAMDPTDREVLALRHFEQLTNVEAAQALGIQERAAAKRYVRALRRLRRCSQNCRVALRGCVHDPRRTHSRRRR